MENSVSQIARSVNWMRLIARVLVLCWATLWVFNFGANLIGGLIMHGGPEGYTGFAFATIGLLLVIGTTWLALRRARAGGIALVILGLVAGSAYLIWLPAHMSGTNYLVTALIIGGPPLAAGILFLTSR